MSCLLETRDHAEQLLNYCSRRLDPPATEIVERHLATCAACRDFVAQQQTVWKAMDAWEAKPVSADFDRRLYARIENDVPWWRALLRPMTLRWNVAASAAGVFVLLTAGLLLNRPTAIPPSSHTEIGGTVQILQSGQVQPEQVERALDAMDMLAEFESQVKSGAASHTKM